MTNERDLALDGAAWPFREARKLLERTGGVTPEKGYVLFETGYGPSGLPHIGTFGEVARTSMLRHAFGVMCDIPTRLVASAKRANSPTTWTGCAACPATCPSRTCCARISANR